MGGHVDHFKLITFSNNFIVGARTNPKSGIILQCYRVLRFRLFQNWSGSSVGVVISTTHFFLPTHSSPSVLVLLWKVLIDSSSWFQRERMKMLGVCKILWLSNVSLWHKLHGSTSGCYCEFLYSCGWCSTSQSLKSGPMRRNCSFFAELASSEVELPSCSLPSHSRKNLCCVKQWRQWIINTHK